MKWLKCQVTTLLELSPIQPGELARCPTCNFFKFWLFTVGELKLLHAQCSRCRDVFCMHSEECKPRASWGLLPQCPELDRDQQTDKLKGGL